MYMYLFLQAHWRPYGACDQISAESAMVTIFISNLLLIHVYTCMCVCLCTNLYEWATSCNHTSIASLKVRCKLQLLQVCLEIPVISSWVPFSYSFDKKPAKDYTPCVHMHTYVAFNVC